MAMSDDDRRFEAALRLLLFGLEHKSNAKTSLIVADAIAVADLLVAGLRKGNQ